MIVTTQPRGGRPGKAGNQQNSAGFFSIDQAASAAGTSREPVKEMMRIRERGAPEIAQAVASGEVAVSDGAPVAGTSRA